ncbi:peroxidase [Stenotrophomonas ginsengisoli]|uniref:Peroxidase n=1 Tax=Stenotrophomonas ginsengisoli TaxID=336566 RepID=A0A0R0DAM8_9GAMM|nr:alpha/beta hydrolase [Stenotrophomonas ginsengisoli]KRG74910.1 peroxidase [Stenotrophomonas ginsengisoli]
MDKCAPLSALANNSIGAVDDSLLAATRHPGSRVPLLFAHGFGQTRHSWAGCAQRLAAHGHPSLAYDARGHGQSPWNPVDLPYQPEQFVDDLIGISGQLPQAPVLVAASMGGLFGLIAQSRWPGLFSAMVLVDITPRWEPRGVERILAFMSAHPDGFDDLAHAADEIARYQPQRERKSDAALRSILRQDQDGRLRWHWDPRLLPELGRNADSHQQRIAEAARRIQCPLLLISGGRSDMVSDATIDEFLQLVPHARHTRIAGATHMVAGDDNDAFTTTVMQYLDALPALATDGESATTHLTGAFQ